VKNRNGLMVYSILSGKKTSRFTFLMHNLGLNDIKRQEKLESLGIHFLRFDDQDVKANVDHVIAAIGDWIREHKK
jgi:hypothetical protein